MFLGAANRDPRRWSAPDEYDLARNPSAHVGFGMGLHRCVGQHVARREAEALLPRVARLSRPSRHTLRAFASLPPRLHAA